MRKKWVSGSFLLLEIALLARIIQRRFQLQELQDELRDLRKLRRNEDFIASVIQMPWPPVYAKDEDIDKS